MHSINRAVFLLYGVFVAFSSLRSIDGIAIEHSDKFFHLVTYGLFAALGFRAVSGRRAFVYLCIGIIIYGGLMEVAQSFTPGRTMSVYDFLANTIGVLIGAFTAQKLFSTNGTKT